jgi:outer membrane lipoprotein-sorting protein
VAWAAVVGGAANAAAPSAAWVADKNAAARGGLAAWHAVSSLSMSGQLEAGGKKNAALPFVLTLKRPHKSRLELKFQEQTALQVYDGAQGWKVRPFLGRNEVEPFSPDEAKSAAAAEDLDGPLLDYAKKGGKLELKGMETVEGHRAYKLKLTPKVGPPRHVWVDASSFLELKIEGEPRRLDGRMRNVAVYYRDYRPEHGLVVPHVLETVVDGVRPSRKITIQHVTVNPPADDAEFAKPSLLPVKLPGQ